MLKSAIFIFIFVGSTASLFSKPQAWEQWRGPSRDGRILDQTTKWPSDLSSVKATWRKDLNEGYSSPIVTTDLVFTVETKDKADEVVRAFDRKSGNQLWETSWKGSMKVPFFARKNGSWVRSTPAYSNGTLYVGGIREVLVALDGKTGKEKWRIDFVERGKSGVPTFGFVSSPLIEGDFLYIQAGAEVTKIRCSDGKKIWGAMKDGRAMYGSAFSSLVIAEVAGKDQLLAQTREELAGLDLASGKVMWRYKVKAFRGMNILTPTIIGDTLFTSTYGGGSSLFTISTDNDGMNISKTWSNKTEGYMSSPITHEGHVYMHGRDKRFHCFEAKTGNLKWSSVKKFSDYASLVANKERALALTADGNLLLIELSPSEFKLVDTKKISDSPTWAHLAVCGEELFVRELKGLAKLQWPQ
ncbi:MAG: PQQ-binding-like beta-propeller repeat protein [Verrucomicrobiaceae bacterium]|nr:PQQ-binding-like beta-propeller repeat protein [Verrucomicrobiaceae bacterium]